MTFIETVDAVCSPLDAELCSQTQRGLFEMFVFVQIVALREAAKRASDDSAASDVCNHRFASPASSFTTRLGSLVFQKYPSVRVPVAAAGETGITFITTFDGDVSLQLSGSRGFICQRELLIYKCT